MALSDAPAGTLGLNRADRGRYRLDGEGDMRDDSMMPRRGGTGDEAARLAALRLDTEYRVANLARSFDEIVEAASDTATDDEHDPEGHTIAWERQQVAGLLAEATLALEAIIAAERRAADGTYGTCVACGEAIGEARLEALPATTNCVACAD